MVHSCGMMDLNMRGNFNPTILKDLATMFGLMAENMRVHGKIIKCMDVEFSFGQMVEDTKVNTSTTKSRAMVSSFGQMVEAIREAGETESKMDVGHTGIRRASRSKEHGSMERR